MALSDQLKDAWAWATGKRPEPSRQETALARDLPPTREPPKLKPVERNAPNPAVRLVPSHAPILNKPGTRQAEKPREVEASKMAFTRTPQPAPTPGGMSNTVYTNKTSTFQRQPPARPETQDKQAAEKQQAADKALPGPSDRIRLRRPGEAPSRDPHQVAQQARARRTLEEFKPPSPDKDRGISR